ncbi:MAG: ABC transporter permease [Dehalococcoidia bacterium]|nr:ABC transporter permease [Dehalococcoidia bacterium]
MAHLQIAKRQPLRHGVGAVDLAAHLLAFWGRRGLLWHMTVRHLRGQYKQSFLGYAWAFVNPLSQMLILSFVFSTLLRFESGGVPFPLFVFVGLLPWIFFSSALASATDAVAGSASLVTKVYFPREILPVAAIFTKVVDLAFGLVILVGLMLYYEHVPTETIVWVPVLFMVHMIFTAGLSLPLAALNLYFHDVRYLVGMALTMWFYLTPVIYPESAVPERYRFIFDVNPNAIFINAYRRVILLDDSPGVERLLLGFAIAGGTFLIGYYLFKRMEPGFADRI